MSAGVPLKCQRETDFLTGLSTEVVDKPISIECTGRIAATGVTFVG